MTKGYTVTVTVVDPVMIGAGPEKANHAACLDYVPGGVLRGALATRWIREYGRPAGAKKEQLAEFTELFETSIVYGPCHSDVDQIQAVSQMFLKYGDPTDDTPAVIDLASPQTNSQLGGRNLNGYTAGKGTNRATPLTTVTRTALEANETALDASLFSRDAIKPGTIMRGRITGQHKWLNSLGSNSFRVRLGAKRSTNGRADIAVVPTEFEPTSIDTSEPFVVRLISPAIMVDRFGRPQPRFTRWSLARALKVEDPTSIEVLDQWTRPDVINGWHVASGFPKPDDLALTVGSTAKISVPGDADIDRLASSGIGLRRCEGFGQVVLNPAPYPSLPNDTVMVETIPHPAIGYFEQLTSNDGPKMTIKSLRDLVKELANTVDPQVADASNAYTMLLGDDILHRLSEAHRQLFSRLGESETSDLEDLAYLLEAHLLDNRLANAANKDLVSR